MRAVSLLEHLPLLGGIGWLYTQRPRSVKSGRILRENK